MLDLLGERTTRDATTTVARGKEYVVGSRKTAVVGEIGPIATHTRFTSIKQGRFRKIVRVVKPVPVWLVALVAAFFTECRLVCVGYIPVPGQEVALIGYIKVSCELFRKSAVQSSEDKRRLTVPWIERV